LSSSSSSYRLVGCCVRPHVLVLIIIIIVIVVFLVLFLVFILFLFVVFVAVAVIFIIIVIVSIVIVIVRHHIVWLVVVSCPHHLHRHRHHHRRWTQISKPAIAPPNPATGTSRGTIGSQGAIGWGHRCSTHGDRGQSRWRIGRRWIIFGDPGVCFSNLTT
jgi:hypothetical protein